MTDITNRDLQNTEINKVDGEKGKMEALDSLMNDYGANTLRYVDLKSAVADALVGLSTEFRNNKAELAALIFSFALGPDLAFVRLDHLFGYV